MIDINAKALFINGFNRIHEKSFITMRLIIKKKLNNFKKKGNKKTCLTGQVLKN